MYQYVECGLDNVVIHGLEPLIDDGGEECIVIPNVAQLHTVIAEEIVTSQRALVGKELRFLRTEMGLTQAELARLLHREPLSVSRWERDEKPIGQNADVVVRLLAIERLKLHVDISVEEMTLNVVASARGAEINIDGSDPENFRPAA